MRKGVKKPKIGDFSLKIMELGQKWAQIRELRRVVTGAMELARNEKKIGSSLQAHPLVMLTAEKEALLSGLNFAEICICSSWTPLHQEPVPKGTVVLPDVPVGVVIELAQGQKCERCWQVLDEVTEKQGQLCNRCHEAVASIARGAS